LKNDVYRFVLQRLSEAGFEKSDRGILFGREKQIGGDMAFQLYNAHRLRHDGGKLCQQAFC
jgi:hypothetical protein